MAVTVHESIESDHNKPKVLSQINVETYQDEYDAYDGRRDIALACNERDQ